MYTQDFTLFILLIFDDCVLLLLISDIARIMEVDEPGVEPEEEVVDIDIVASNVRYGVTDWNERYQCFTCCFCARPLIQTLGQQKARDDIEKRQGPRPNTAWQTDIDRRIADWTRQQPLYQQQATPPSSRVLDLAYRQRIHASCNSVMTDQEADQLVAHNRDRIYIPDESHWSLNAQLDYTAMAGRLVVLCERCDECLNFENQGVCYVNERSVDPRKHHYLHFSCYDYLRNLRIKEYKRIQSLEEEEAG